MKCFRLAFFGALCVQAMFAANSVRAQGYNPRPVYNRVSRPAVSPYLNLLRRGQSPALNYYNLVQPQLTFQNSIAVLQQLSAGNQQAISQLQGSTGLPTTGHPVQFMNHGGYFLNTGTSTPGGARAGGTQINRPRGTAAGGTTSASRTAPSSRSTSRSTRGGR